MPTEIDYSADSLQGTAVILLDSRGHNDAAEMLEIARLKFAADDDFTSYRFKSYQAILEVEAQLLSHYTEDVVELIYFAFRDVTKSYNYAIASVIPVPLPVGKDWREQRQQERLGNVSNQGIRLPQSKPLPEKDGFRFGHPSEVPVYDALVALAASRPKTDTLGIAVNVPVRVGGRTFIPDFIVSCAGRVGIIEVDGATHNRRFLADASRNDLLQDAGFKTIYRIPAEDTGNPTVVREPLGYVPESAAEEVAA